jgi:hypothetical protein
MGGEVCGTWTDLSSSFGMRHRFSATWRYGMRLGLSVAGRDECPKQTCVVVAVRVVEGKGRATETPF